MDDYESLCSIGEGTYGTVLKCRHKSSGMVVAVKRFKDSDKDELIRKTALREIKMLKQMSHENIVRLLEVVRRKGRLYLIFEYVDRTILDDLEKSPSGLDNSRTGVVRKWMWQLFRAVDYLHRNNVIHRDLKPENILVSKYGIIKLCDFGFARPLSTGTEYTDYVATRWYRAPELLVGDTHYSTPIDIWAAGCIMAELVTGQPLFPGDSDLDQLFRIVQHLGPLPKQFTHIFEHSPIWAGTKIPNTDRRPRGLESRLGHQLPMDTVDVLRRCLSYDTSVRPTAKQVMDLPYFRAGGWIEQFEEEMTVLLSLERMENARLDQIWKRRASVSVALDNNNNADSAAQSAPQAQSNGIYRPPPLVALMEQQQLASSIITTKKLLNNNGNNSSGNNIITATNSTGQQQHQQQQQQHSNNGGNNNLVPSPVERLQQQQSIYLPPQKKAQMLLMQQQQQQQQQGYGNNNSNVANHRPAPHQVPTLLTSKPIGHAQGSLQGNNYNNAISNNSHQYGRRRSREDLQQQRNNNPPNHQRQQSNNNNNNNSNMGGKSNRFPNSSNHASNGSGMLPEINGVRAPNTNYEYHQKSQQQASQIRRPPVMASQSQDPDGDVRMTDYQQNHAQKKHSPPRVHGKHGGIGGNTTSEQSLTEGISLQGHAVNERRVV